MTALPDPLHRTATGALTSMIYSELRQLALSMMRKEQPGHTLQATALVHEAYLRLARSRNLDIADKAMFYRAAAVSMRRILIEHARGRKTLKRDGGDRIDLDPAAFGSAIANERLLELHDALDRLAAVDPRQATLVELRFFAGLSNEEIAEILETSARTVKREWAHARAWLRGELES